MEWGEERFLSQISAKNVLADFTQHPSTPIHFKGGTQEQKAREDRLGDVRPKGGPAFGSANAQRGWRDWLALGGRMTAAPHQNIRGRTDEQRFSPRLLQPDFRKKAEAAYGASQPENRAPGTDQEKRGSQTVARGVPNAEMVMTSRR